MTMKHRLWYWLALLCVVMAFTPDGTDGLVTAKLNELNNLKDANPQASFFSNSNPCLWEGFTCNNTDTNLLYRRQKI